MNEVIKALKERRSIRKFKPELPPKEDLEQIIDAGLYAASGMGSIWIHRCREEFEQEDYAQMLADLGIEGDYEGIGHLAVGYIDGDSPAPAPRRDGRVYWCE